MDPISMVYVFLFLLYLALGSIAIALYVAWVVLAAIGRGLVIVARLAWTRLAERRAYIDAQRDVNQLFDDFERRLSRLRRLRA
jgi:small-conductance mechanosensitive channel